MLRARLLPLLLVAFALVGLGLTLWSFRSSEPTYAGLALGSSLPHVQAQLEAHGGELRCRTLPWTHMSDCTWEGELPTLPGTLSKIHITADQRHRVLGEIRVDHRLPQGTSAEVWMEHVLRQWGVPGSAIEVEEAGLKYKMQRRRAQSGYRGAQIRVEERSGRVEVILFDTTIAAHAAEPGPV